MFAEKYLQDPLITEIYYDCDGGYVGDELCYMGMKMHFARFEDDKRRCVFVESGKTSTCKRHWEDHEWEEYQEIKYRHWREKVHMYRGYSDGSVNDEGGRFDIPAHQIRIKTHVNDTELPDCRFDFQKREISLNWFGMFDRFYREVAAVDRSEDKSVYGNIMPEMDAFKANGGRFNDFNDLVPYLRKWISSSKTARRDVRRFRIKEWYDECWGNEEFPLTCTNEFLEEHYVEDETEALKAVREMEKGVDFIEFAEDADDNRRGMERDRANGWLADEFDMDEDDPWEDVDDDESNPCSDEDDEDDTGREGEDGDEDASSESD